MNRRVRLAAVLGLVAAACGADSGSCDLPDLEEDDEDKVSVSVGVSGTWTGSDFSLTCQPSGTVVFPPSAFTMTLTQTVTPSGITVSGTFSASDPAAGTASGAVSGTLTGTTLTFAIDVTITPPIPPGGADCAVSLTGTGTVSGNSMTISFAGSVVTGSCCGGPGGNVSGTATATR